MIPPPGRSTPPPVPDRGAHHSGLPALLRVSLTAMTADNIEHVISYWVIYQAFHSPMLAGFAVISHWMPFLLFSVYSGALADRYDCRKLIQAGQILFMVASLSWGLLFLTGTLRMWHAVVLLLLHGAAGVTVVPATQLILHDMVGPAQLQSAIRLNATARYLAILLGPAVGGGLMLLLGPAWGLLANVLIYAPFSIFLWTIPYTGHLRDGVVERPAARLGLRDALRVFGEVRGDRRIVVMIVLGGVTVVLRGQCVPGSMPEYAHPSAPRGGRRYSLLLAANATGAILGSVLSRARTAAPECPLRDRVRGGGGISRSLLPRRAQLSCRGDALVIAGAFNIAFRSMAQTLVSSWRQPRVRGAVVGLFNTAMLGLRAGSGSHGGGLGALINVQWSLRAERDGCGGEIRGFAGARDEAPPPRTASVRHGVQRLTSRCAQPLGVHMHARACSMDPGPIPRDGAAMRPPLR